MKKVDRRDIREIVDELGVAMNKDATFRRTLDEYATLVHDGRIAYEAKEGVYGFWEFKIVKNADETYSIRAKFVGDIFYYSIYM